MEAIDCSTRLTKNTAAALNAAGISAVGRYLGYKIQKWWKAITPEEAQTILNSGMGIFLIWESNPTHPDYFSYAKGLSDAGAAIEEAQNIKTPPRVAIYFTVDYDAQAKDMPAIAAYIRGCKDGLQGKYLTGAYGSFRVLTALKASDCPPDRYYQTYAWSDGQVFSGHIYQYQNGIILCGIQVDKDTIHDNAGLWSR